MMKRDLKDIRGIIWDLDGTLYRYTDYFKESCNVAAARTALDLGLDMTYDAALDIARTSEQTYGNSFKGFEQYGIRYEDYHHGFHEKIDHLVLEKNQALFRALAEIRLPMVVLTNASRGWAMRTLDHLGMLPFFAHGENLIALEDSGFKSKAYHTEGFLLASTRLNLDPDKLLVVEDMDANLVVPKTMGMTTALVHHTGAHGPDRYPAHIDYVFDDTLDLINAILVSVQPL